MQRPAYLLSPRKTARAGALLWRLARSAGSDPGRVLKVQFGQPRPIQQHDLPLGLAEEAEDTLAVKI
jgi:hypothetical protein